MTGKEQPVHALSTVHLTGRPSIWTCTINASVTFFLGVCVCVFITQFLGIFQICNRRPHLFTKRARIRGTESAATPARQFSLQNYRTSSNTRTYYYYMWRIPGRMLLLLFYMCQVNKSKDITGCGDLNGINGVQQLPTLNIVFNPHLWHKFRNALISHRPFVYRVKISTCMDHIPPRHSHLHVWVPSPYDSTHVWSAHECLTNYLDTVAAML